MPLPKELCLNRYDDYVCLEAANHSNHHLGTNANGDTATWVHVKSPIEAQLESALANGESYRLANIELSKKLEQAKEDEAYLVNKVKNQAKSLTQMHKGIKQSRRRAEYHFAKWEKLEAVAKQLKASGTYGLDYHAVKKDNDSLRKELSDLRENFTFTENSWYESNEHLKERLNNVQKRLDDALVKCEEWKANWSVQTETIADYKEVIKQKSEALQRATDLLRKIRRFVREIGL